jgi:SOS response regulatory protein OraA/RecX
VRRKIESAGIDSGTARQAVDEVFGAIDSAALLERALSKRLRRRGSDLANQADFRRVFRYLVSQGFEPGKVIERLKTHLKDADAGATGPNDQEDEDSEA